MAIERDAPSVQPTFWMRKQDEQLGDDQVVEQMWFPGVHSNVGGGYDNTQLSDMALVWMISRVQQLTGLHFDETEIKRDIWPCAAGTLYRSSTRKWLAQARSILPAAVQAAAGSTAAIRQARVTVCSLGVKSAAGLQDPPWRALACKYDPVQVDKYPDVSTLKGIVQPNANGWREKVR